MPSHFRAQEDGPERFLEKFPGNGPGKDPQKGSPEKDPQKGSTKVPRVHKYKWVSAINGRATLAADKNLEKPACVTCVCNFSAIFIENIMI